MSRKLAHVEAQAVVDALTLMMRLRGELPYRSRGFLLLNAACHRLSRRFWMEMGIEPACALRSQTPALDFIRWHRGAR